MFNEGSVFQYLFNEIKQRPSRAKLNCLQCQGLIPGLDEGVKMMNCNDNDNTNLNDYNSINW